MDIKIDWVSFTLPIDEEPTIALEADRLARLALKKHSVDWYLYIYNGIGFDYVTGRAPYYYGFRRHDDGVSVFIGSNTGTVLFELTGRACEKLLRQDNGKDMLLAIANHATRVDVACDMECVERPRDFASARTKKQNAVLGYQKSSTGETVYLGSQKSERYCRVYRYEPPHPRSALLRVEYVYRRDYAKALLWGIVDTVEIAQIAARLGEPYGWLSKNWDLDHVTAAELLLPQPRRHQNKTVVWLLNTCAPALRRCLDDHALSVDDFWFSVYPEDE